MVKSHVTCPSLVSHGHAEPDVNVVANVEQERVNVKDVIANVYQYIERSTMTWYLVPAADEDGGVDSMLLEAVRACKIGVDDVVG